MSPLRNQTSMNHVLATCQNSLCIRRMNCFLNRGLPFRFIRGAPARLGTLLLEPLQSNSSPIIARFYLAVNDFSVCSAPHVAEDEKDKGQDIGITGQQEAPNRKIGDCEGRGSGSSAFCTDQRGQAMKSQLCIDFSDDNSYP